MEMENDKEMAGGRGSTHRFDVVVQRGQEVVSVDLQILSLL